MAFVEVENLYKRFVTRKRIGLFKSKKEVVEALVGVSFKVEKGRLLSLMGLNGAGKSTAVKILATSLLPDSGIRESATIMS
ncbi:MAG: ATP-binding cassette domain-containing protein [Thermoproteus sp.]|nr:ATP-binding cassette domain-containing protein [Thermoproteus sp.]